MVTMLPMVLHLMVISSSLRCRGGGGFYHRSRTGFHSKKRSRTLALSRTREREQNGRSLVSAAVRCSAPSRAVAYGGHPVRPRVFLLRFALHPPTRAPPPPTRG